MTHIYDWGSFPNILDVICPRCGGLATFTYALEHPITRKADVPLVQDHPLFAYRRYQDGCGHFRHVAVIYPGLHGAPTLPVWWDSRCTSRALDDGSVCCPHCLLRARHRLRWPDDAYFQVGYRQQILWAFNRESAAALLAYVMSPTRSVWCFAKRQSLRRWTPFLWHIPTVFKTRKARAEVARRLNHMLRGDVRVAAPRPLTKGRT